MADARSEVPERRQEDGSEDSAENEKRGCRRKQPEDDGQEGGHRDGQSSDELEIRVPLHLVKRHENGTVRRDGFKDTEDDEGWNGENQENLAGHGETNHSDGVAKSCGDGS